MLERAATRSRWMRTDAQGTLALLYDIFDPAPERALVYAEMMIRERPTSPLAHSLYAQALAFAGKWNETLAETARDLESRARRAPRSRTRRPPSIITAGWRSWACAGSPRPSTLSRSR